MNYARIWHDESKKVVEVECASHFQAALLETLDRIANLIERQVRQGE